MTTLSKSAVPKTPPMPTPSAEQLPDRYSFPPPDHAVVRHCSQRVREMVREGALFLPLSVEQYHAMIDTGILAEGEPYELLAGQIVRKQRNAAGEDPMTVGGNHALTVKRLGRLSRQFEPHGCHLQTQQPVVLPNGQEPEPDGAIVRGTEEDYASRHPWAGDVLCVMEVADASLKHDQTIKLAIYADAGVGVYVILNLPGRVAEVHTEPRAGDGRYGRLITLKPDQVLELPTSEGPMVSVPVASLLP